MKTREIQCCGNIHDRSNLEKWIDRLQSTGLKLTKPRRAILEYLHNQNHPITNREIYDGLSATYDYGPLGAELKNNIKSYWWKSMTQLHENIAVSYTHLTLPTKRIV